MILVKYTIQDSPIHGKGIFADEPIAAGAVIWRWGGTEMTNAEFEDLDQLEQAEMQEHSYQSKTNGNWYILDDDIKFINHSNTPNTTENIEPGDGAGVLVAKRNIEPGEELTQDYRDFESEDDIRARGILLESPVLK